MIFKFLKKNKFRNNLYDKLLEPIKIIRIYCKSIHRFFWWGWKMRWSYDWDHSYLYEIIYLKLDKMIKEFNKNGHLEWNTNFNSTEMKKIRITKECIKRLKDDNFGWMLDKHYIKWDGPFLKSGKSTEKNLRESLFIYNNVKNEKDKKLQKKEFNFAINHEEELKKQTMEMFCNYFNKYSQKWWD